MPTHVILDGLADPRDAQWLSARWAEEGFVNAIDVGGQSAWLEPKAQATEPAGNAMTEAGMARAGELARQVGVEMRDRVGAAFQPNNDLDAMRQHMTREYRLRLAQALVFGLPALAVHYLAPVLARGGGQSAGSLIYPWIFEMILVGWTLWTAGLPMIWQGALAIMRGRFTGDLLTAAVALVAFAPSALGVVSFLWTSEPWLPAGPAPLLASAPATSIGAAAEAQAHAPLFHVALMAVMLAVAQRWLMWRSIASLAGRGNWMVPRFGRLVAAWLVAATVAAVWIDLAAGLAFALLLPPMLAMGGINRRNPGLLTALPVVVFAPIFLLGPGRFQFAPGAEQVRFEIAAGFAWLMTMAMAWNWRSMRHAPAQRGKPRR